MNINWDQSIKDYDEKEIVLEDKPLTVGRIAIIALTSQGQEEANEQGEKRFQLGKLAYDISKGRDDLSIEELALVKTRIGKFFNPMIVFKAWSLLEENK